jgi:hypothetical protein
LIGHRLTGFAARFDAVTMSTKPKHLPAAIGKIPSNTFLCSARPRGPGNRRSSGKEP